MMSLVCPKCLKPVTSIITSGMDASLYCQCIPTWATSMTVLYGTVTIGMNHPYKSKRAAVPAIFQEAFKDGDLEL